MPLRPLKHAPRLSDRWRLSPEDVYDLAGEYESFLRSEHTREARPGVFHPSALGMCGRANVYEYLEYPHDPVWKDIKTPEIFFLGHKVHEFLQERVGRFRGKYSFRALHEVGAGRNDFLLEKYGIGGTTDTLMEIKNLETLQRGIIEFKSIGKEGFDGPAGVKTTNTPKPQHLEQIHVYMYRFDCPVGWVWYYCKNSSETHIIPVVFDDEIFQGVIDKVVGWKKLADSGKLPMREESWFGCKDCKYAQTCNPSILNRRKSPSGSMRKYAKTRR